MMWSNGMAAVVLRQVYLMRATPSRLLSLFGWVGIDIPLWGFITRYLNSVAASSVNFIPLMLGAILLWSFFTRAMQGVTIGFFEDVWSRNLLNIFASPLAVWEYVAGLVVWGVISSMVSLVVMLILTTTLFGLSFFAYGLALVLFLLVLFLFGISLGIVGAAIVLRLGPSAEWFVWPIPAVISPFVGVLYPLSTLPDWMHSLAYVLPPSYVFEGMRAIVLGGDFSAPLLLWGAILAAGYIVIAGWFFARVYHHAVRKTHGRDAASAMLMPCGGR